MTKKVNGTAKTDQKRTEELARKALAKKAKLAREKKEAELAAKIEEAKKAKIEKEKEAQITRYEKFLKKNPNHLVMPGEHLRF